MIDDAPAVLAMPPPVIRVGGDRCRRVLVRCALLVAAALAVGACALPGDSIVDGEGILGTYSVNGVDPLGTEYSGTVTIDAAEDGSDTYVVQWLVTGTLQEGVGRLDGDRFTVEWATIGSAGANPATGTATYTLDQDGVLRGTRTVDGVDEPGTEEIFPEA